MKHLVCLLHLSLLNIWLPRENSSDAESYISALMCSIVLVMLYFHLLEEMIENQGKTNLKLEMG